MNTAASPLADLAKKLAHKQNELDKLRRKFDVRLSSLERRKELLQADLQRVESEIHAAAQQSSALAAAAPVVTAIEAQPAVAPSGKMTLPLYLIHVVTELGRPVTVTELADELKKRKFRTKSKALVKLVGNRVHDMLKKGYLARAEGTKGVVLGHGTPVRGRPGRKPKAASAQASVNGVKTKGRRRKNRVSLRDLIAELLGASDHPMKAKEIADEALKAGYKTKSKNFIDNVWTALGSMDNIENVKGEGYRLK